jgi:hypothetical protein
MGRNGSRRRRLGAFSKAPTPRKQHGLRGNPQIPRRFRDRPYVFEPFAKWQFIQMHEYFSEMLCGVVIDSFSKVQ